MPVLIPINMSVKIYYCNNIGEGQTIVLINIVLIGDVIKRNFLVILVIFKVFFQPNNHMNVFVFGIR